MPQISQIIGVNSVTNIDLGKGLMPAPISEMRTGLKMIHESVLLTASSCPTGDARRRLKVHAMRIRSLFLTFIQDSGKWPIY